MLKDFTGTISELNEISKIPEIFKTYRVYFTYAQAFWIACQNKSQGPCKEGKKGEGRKAGPGEERK